MRVQPKFLSLISVARVPGPAAAAKASSPMKKSRSSVPRFADKLPPAPAPPVKYEGLLAIAGLPDPEPPAPPAGPFVAMAVGKTKDGESLPANPVRSVNCLCGDQGTSCDKPSLV